MKLSTPDDVEGDGVPEIQVDWFVGANTDCGLLYRLEADGPRLAEIPFAVEQLGEPMDDLTSTFDRNFYQEVREGYRGVVGQDVGQLHLEAPFGDRALLLEFASGFFASREGLAGARYVRNAAAGAEPVQRRDLRRGPRSACTGRHGLVSTSAWWWWHPARPQWYVVRSWG